jgi:hypothetical protein
VRSPARRALRRIAHSPRTKPIVSGLSAERRDNKIFVVSASSGAMKIIEAMKKKAQSAGRMTKSFPLCRERGEMPQIVAKKITNC